MYFFYVDETGNRDTPYGEDGTRRVVKDWLYVLTAVGLLDHKWHSFDKNLSRKKLFLINNMRNPFQNAELSLADAEIKSNWVRIPKERQSRPFIKDLSDKDLTELVDLFYRQLNCQPMNLVSVVVDKRHLPDYMDAQKLQRKAWELLLESVEWFMRAEHPKHQATMIADDVSIQENRSLALKHSYFQEKGTAAGILLQHICEMPLFVRSELSNGVQLADLCSYNIYRAFKTQDLSYPFFRQILPTIWDGNLSEKHIKGRFHGIRIFPDTSPLMGLRDAVKK